MTSVARAAAGSAARATGPEGPEDGAGVGEVRRVAEDRRRTATGAWSARRRARDAGHHGDDVPVRRSPGACVDDRLAEFEQRDPAAFGRWPPTAGTGGDPARFFRHGPSWRSTGDAAW